MRLDKDPEIARAVARHEYLRRKKQARRALRELEARLRAGHFDPDDWLDDERPAQGV